ncbi:MAG: WD40 repeat protein [Pseudoalteromonas tetraodonis]
MNLSHSRTCPNCGALVSEDAPCPGCALSGVLDVLGFNAPAAPAPRFSPLDLPSEFGHYRVTREIAGGGMGMVYEAEDTRLGRRVALKMLRQVFFATELERLRFQSEAELASQLEHPNIVPIHEVGEHDGQPYFTMKYIRGNTLADRLNGVALDPREAAALMVVVARAVHHAHQHGVLHRDLKPANMLLDDAGVPWLTDFGLATLLDTDSGLTLTQTIAGTPEYMSPEQAAGRRSEISTATDVWSLGVILYQMLTGRSPFHADTNPEILRRVAEQEPPPPSTIIHHLDRDLETLCLRCLEKNPERRLSSAGELAMELERWQRGEPIHARRITSGERLCKWARRHPYPAIVLSAFVIVVLGAAAAITSQWRRATANEQRALSSAEIERRTAYSATLAQALAVRERHDFGLARRLLDGIDPTLRGFDWRLLHGLCRGDELDSFRLGDGVGAQPQCLTMLPGGEQAAFISADGRLHVRNLRGEEIRPPRQLPPLDKPGQRSYGLTISPDGQRLAYANGDVLRVLETDSLELLYEERSRLPQFDWLDDTRLLYGFNGSVAAPPWPEPGAWILDFRDVHASSDPIPRTGFPEMCAPLAVSPDRRSFVLHRVEATPDSWARFLHIYKVDGDFTSIPKPVFILPGREYPGEIALSRTGKFLAFSAGASLKQSARVLEVATGRMLIDHQFRFSIHGLAIDSDERRLALVGGDSAVRVYDFSRGVPEGADANTYDDEVDLAESQRVGGHGAHSPPRNLITRSAQDGRARFYLGHEMAIRNVAFAASGSLVTAGDEGTVRHWPAGIPRPAVRLGHVKTSYEAFHPAASTNGLRVLYKTDVHLVQLCDIPLSRSAAADSHQPIASWYTPLAVLQDGRPITLDQLSTDIVVWTMENGSSREQRRLRSDCKNSMHDGRTRQGVLSADERHLAGSMNGWLFSADLEQGTVKWSGDLGKRVSPFASHDISPDGEWIASSDFGARVTIHRFAEPDKIVSHLGEESGGYATAIAFGRDGRKLYTGDENGRIRVWDTASWQEITALGWLAHRGAVTALAVSHNRTLIATSGDDSLKLFPIAPEPGESRRRERLSFQLGQAANWIRFARDRTGADRALLHCTPDGRLNVWETDKDEQPNEPVPVDLTSLPFPLTQHQITLLPDGKVLVVGGHSTAPVALSACHLYEPDTNTWSLTGSLLRPRSRPQLTLLPNGKVLVAGGVARGGVPLASCELYDPGTGIWTPTGSMAAPRVDGACLLLKNGDVLAGGGSDAQSCELYDHELGTWSPTGAMNTPHPRGSWVMLNDGGVLVAGGSRAEEPQLGSERYDPASGTWHPAGALNTLDLSAPAIRLRGGNILIAGGGASHPGCRLYDPVSEEWQAADPLPRIRARHTATLLANGNVLVAGGNVLTSKYLNDSPASNSCVLYDPSTNTWSIAPSLITARNAHTATLLPNGKVLFVGGRDEKGSSTHRVELYKPHP